MVLYGVGMKLHRRAMGIDRAVITRNTEGATRPGATASPLSSFHSWGHSLEITKRRAVGALPKCFPPYQTCHRWLQYWRKTGTFEKILFALANMALEQGKLGLDEGFIDATFAPAKKGVLGREDQKGQRDKDNGNCGGTWLSDSIAYWKRFSRRGNTGWKDGWSKNL